MSEKNELLNYMERNQHDYELMCEIRLIASKAIKAINDSKKSSKVAIKIPVEAMQIALDMYSKVLERYPHYQGRVNVESWGKDIDLINRKDGHDYQSIEEVMEWSQEDDFWSQNIRSGSNLRKHFLTLLTRIQSDKDKAPIVVKA